MADHAPTPGQTVGPFFGFSLPYDGGPELVRAAHPDAIRLHGRVVDGAGDPVPDALLELHQPDRSGELALRAGSLHRDGWTFTGWGRAATDAAGEYSFTTVLPGASAGTAAFFSLTVFARGLLDRLLTRVYLPDVDVEAVPLLAGLPSGRRQSMIAVADADGYRFDVVLQGEGETVFIDVST